MAQRSKKHHYLPQFVLKGFADRRRVATIDLAGPRTFVQAIADAAAENNYNTLRLEDGSSDAAESAIAQIEGAASGVLARIGDGDWLSDADERLAVATFLALQYLRVPANRQFSNAMADQILKLQVAAGGPKQLRDIMRSQGHDPTDEEVREEWARLGKFDNWNIALPTEHHVVQALQHALEFGPALSELYAWGVVRFERRALLISDVPVLLVPAHDWPQWSGVGILTAGTILLPVSRRTQLVLISRVDAGDLDDFEIHPTVRRALEFNRLQMASAQRRIYHHPDDDLPFLVGPDFKLPSERSITTEDEHSRELRNSLRAMGEWWFDNPDQPHPMSGKAVGYNPPGH